MSFPTNEPNHEPVPSRLANQQRALARVGRAGLIATTLVGIGVLAAACGGATSGSGVVSLGTTTTTTVSSVALPKNPAEGQSDALRYVGCMRTHGEPNMPEPNFSGNGNHVHISIDVNAGSGVDPNSRQFAAASNACKHLLPNGGVAKGNAISSADQADYLKAAECMRSHGIPNFPDPTFQDNSVAFNAPGSRIDTNSPEFKSALATCEKLIPAGLPYGSSGPS